MIFQHIKPQNGWTEERRFRQFQKALMDYRDREIELGQAMERIEIKLANLKPRTEKMMFRRGNTVRMGEVRMKRQKGVSSEG